MEGALGQVLTYAPIPVAATILGGIIPLFFTPGARLRSSLQHFAGGLVFVAVAAELLPKMLEAHSLSATILGFFLGVTLMLGIKWLSERSGQKGIVDVGRSGSLVLAAGVDYIVDGLLVGIGFVLGAKSGGLLTFALSVEGMFLALAVSAALKRDKDVSTARTIITAAIFGALFAAGAIGGAALLSRLSGFVHATMLAFGAAALIYLVTEELLVEAHDDRVPEDALTVALFFAGFLLLIGVEMSL
jgi:zinc transporter, ZIP family